MASWVKSAEHDQRSGVHVITHPIFPQKNEIENGIFSGFLTISEKVCSRVVTKFSSHLGKEISVLCLAMLENWYYIAYEATDTDIFFSYI